ncbi:MAG: porin family protein [Salinarimonadaceae bacterium]|nr:MAG: porin family protein [Salinarimonadaceae bacterium]
MKRTLLASAAALLLAAPAFAADLPSRQPAPAPFVSAPPMFTWTGFYAGVNAGWSQNRADIANRGFTGTGGAGAYPSFSTAKRHSFIGGFQAGYNQQFGNFVAGVEADINWLGNRRGSGSAAIAGLPGAVTTVSASSRLDWLGTVRGRAGFAFDRVLIYGTAGFAFGAPDNRLMISNAATMTHTGSNNKTKVGWTVGGGLEYAVLDNVSLRGEYLYYDLGRSNVTANPTAAGTAAGLGGASNTARFENTGHIARIGLNYRF